ncbi:NADH:flavin oxidoreductase [Bordetella bronchiseptica]|uniref:oxidoreductase n=1 Tax=Bordetella bronchiseptica TaxID=518 RepID=UPI00028F7BDF|nr:NADH:flavin oxidoreductase [Bordetella bronchiseptica]AWP78078.1 NADH:flavin oxidoreductase [Bordetella bronchiseptica]AZW10810.1 NADH:flavin oxidoreductase [Bordetella bronchiseptica]KAB1448573.1 NADH:flavin oxidoreductase [Bordetella bronchiseptica]KAB1574895.1 NADH:flavin oxidoreductase [Bordetella bronchiseptica]KDB57744.1 oxidoreductase, FAD/FMN dependent [Bordetella bronchiseptica A1-7]
MTAAVASLFDTVTLGQLELSNRVSVAPMTRISATSAGLATDRMVAYYASFAQGGFGLIITEGLYTDDRHSPGYVLQPGIINDEQEQSWRHVVDAVHQAGAKIVAQIMHAGALVHGNPYGKDSIAPSAVQPRGRKSETYEGAGPYPLPREATKADIAKVIDGFAMAAKRVKSAGFDGVEIHGANGYLLDEFLTGYTNRRTDEYGGSTENRVRLLVEVATAVRAAVGDGFTVGVRISQAKVNDFKHKWAEKEQDAEVIFGRLGRAGLDFIHVSEHEAWKPAFDGGDASLAALAKKHGQLPVIANGGLDDPARAAELMASGHADVISLGKGALANPDWPGKVERGQALRKFDAERLLHPNARIKAFEAQVSSTAV